MDTGFEASQAIPKWVYCDECYKQGKGERKMEIREIRKNSWKHYGSPAGCVHLGACDIGRAREAHGKGWIYTTWGRNLSLAAAEKLGYPVVLNDACSKPTYEIVLEGHTLAGILAGMAVRRAVFDVSR